MDGNIETPQTPPTTDTTIDSDDEDDKQEPMTFNFNGPQSTEEVRDQAVQESASFNRRSQSADSSQDEAPTQPISFNFGPQPVERPAADIINAFTAGSRRPQMPAGVRELAAAINNRRRAATNREYRGVATAYIDEDESGTYDPKKSRRTPPSPLRSAKRVRVSNAVNKDGTLKPKRPTKQIGFRYEMLVKFKFQSNKALDYLRTLPPGPYESQSSNADEEDDCYDSGYGGSFKRKREVKRPRRLGATATRSDGLTIDGLIEGHPQRRGCRCCFSQGNDECTLIEHPDEYPCEACDDAETDCVLIISPEFKKSCLRCKGKRRNCSYSLDGGKGADACDACEEEGVTCCAEPLREPSITRRFAKLPARVKGKPTPAAKVPVRERMYVACNQCRGTGKRCTNRGKADPGPCSNCRKAGHSCKFVYPPTRIPQLPTSSSKPKAKTLSSSKAYVKSDSSTSPRDRIGTPHSPNTLTATIYSELEKKNTRKAEKLIAKGIAHINIITSFCHPITFNYVPDPLLKNPCSWCDNPFFGLWGLASTSGPRRVEGFYLPNGGGFEEFFNGFSELGYSRSVMCIACTYARVRITQCPTHRLLALDVKTGEFDLDILNEKKWGLALQAYEDGDMKGAELVRNAKWCSVCPATATFKCCSPQFFDENGEPVTPQQHAQGHGLEGCGLLVCEDCADLMGKLVRGGARTGARQLDTMVAEIRRNRWRYTEGVRADAEFLTSGGELLRRLGEGMGASEGKVDDEGDFKFSKMKGEGGWIASGGNGGGMKERKRDGWMNGNGKGKQAARISMGGMIKGKTTMGTDEGLDGSKSMNGSTGPRSVSTRPSSSTTSSTGSIFNITNVKSERKFCTTAKSSQNTTVSNRNQSSQYGNNGSMPPPSSRSSHSSSFTNPWSSTSHFASSSSRDMNGAGYTYGYGTRNENRGIKREKDTRGEIMFGGLLKERKEDVERAFRGQMGFIDLTEDD
ncbi:hypothetical protein ONS96_013214 [Cadophora gregata f. sp. sojae]|nr:hypothetical protein ONS96_013214 [Cadophora gregata f. sp. sojae]